MSPYALQPWLAAYPPGSRGALDAPLVPLPRLVDDAAERHGDRPALAYLGLELTYAELRRAVDSFAAALAGLGVGRGDRVAVVLPDCPQHVIAVFGVLRLGAVVVQPEPLATADELGRQIADSGATVAVCLDRGYGALAAVRDRTALRHVVVTSLADYLPRRARLSLRLPIARARQARAEVAVALPEGARVRRFSDLLRQRLAPVGQTEVDAEREVAVLRYTTGAGDPARAAMLTHRGLLASAYQVGGWLPDAQPGREVVLGSLPLSTPEGFTLCLTVSLLLAGTLVLLPRLDDEVAAAALVEQRPTLLPGGEDVLRSVTRTPASADRGLRSVRTVLAVGGPLPAELRDHLEQTTGAGVVEVHGTSALTHATPAGGAHRPGTVGLPLPGTRAKIVDPGDAAREMPVGAPGALAVIGPQLFAGYWRDPQATRAAFTRDGFFLTGNTATMDADGFFRVLAGEQHSAPSPAAGPAGTATAASGTATAGTAATATAGTAAATAGTAAVTAGTAPRSGAGTTTRAGVSATPAAARAAAARTAATRAAAPTPAPQRPPARRPGTTTAQDEGRGPAAAAPGVAPVGTTGAARSARPRPQGGRPTPRSRPRPGDTGTTADVRTSDAPARTGDAPARASDRPRQPASRQPASRQRDLAAAPPRRAAALPVPAPQRQDSGPDAPARRPSPRPRAARAGADPTPPEVAPSPPTDRASSGPRPRPARRGSAGSPGSARPGQAAEPEPTPPAQPSAARAAPTSGRRAAVPPFRVEEVVDAAHVAVVFDQTPPSASASASTPVADPGPAAPGPRDASADRPHRTGARRARRRERPTDEDGAQT